MHLIYHIHSKFQEHALCEKISIKNCFTYCGVYNVMKLMIIIMSVPFISL